MKLRNVALALSLAAGLLISAAAQAANRMTELVVGYQPYDTISYSAAVIRDRELYKKHLPGNLKVTFEAALQDSVIMNAMIADRQHIGYLGDMPAVVGTTRTDIAPIKLVASLGLSAGQRCNVIMVRADAPQFESPEEAVKWLDGRIVAAPKDSCAERFLRTVMQTAKISPSEILSQSLEDIATDFRVRKIDAAVLWEPTVSRIGDLVGEGLARVVATGHSFDSPDAGFIAMRADFVKNHPDIAAGWLKTELEAQLFITDPGNWAEVGAIVSRQAIGVTPMVAWFALYGAVPARCGGAPERDTKPFVFSPAVRSLLEGTYAFLHENRIINVDRAPEGAIDDSIARRVAKEMDVTLPLDAILPMDKKDAPTH